MVPDHYIIAQSYSYSNNSGTGIPGQVRLMELQHCTYSQPPSANTPPPLPRSLSIHFYFFLSLPPRSWLPVHCCLSLVASHHPDLSVACLPAQLRLFFYPEP